MVEIDRLLNLPEDLTLSTISTAEALRSRLSTRQEVTAFRTALETGGVTVSDMEGLARQLIAPFVRGIRFHADIVIAAMVVAIEPLPLESFDRFLEDLARVKIAEMPMAPRVARLTLRERAQRIAQLTSRELTIADPLPRAQWPPTDDRNPMRIEIGGDYRTLDLREA